jgi:hypothetical protein
MVPKVADKLQDQIDDKLDEASALSFPASDPPFFMGSTAIVGVRRSVVALAPRIPASTRATPSDKKSAVRPRGVN